MPATLGQNAKVVLSGSSLAGAVKPRIDSIDLLRGIVMVVMALDHTREFFTYATFFPTDPARTTLPYYVTRWVTLLCAPTFVFLAGTGIYLQLARGKSKRELSKFLLTRGLWLVFVELFVLHFAWLFNFSFAFDFIQIIWVIGWSMVLFAGLIRLPFKAILAFGLVLMFGHNLLDLIPPPAAGTLLNWRILLHGVGFIQINSPFPMNILVSYAFLPWPGVMALGFCFGRLFDLREHQRDRLCWWIGGSALLLFCILRTINRYGDPAPWRSFGSPLRTAMSFMNVSKYPPSLLFLLVTLGIVIAAFPTLERCSGGVAWLRKALVIYGRVPFFYYVLHVALIHLLALLTAAALGLDWRWYISNFPRGSVIAGVPPGYGFSLWIVYLVWILVVVALYPACRWFADVRRRRRDWWLSYL